MFDYNNTIIAASAVFVGLAVNHGSSAPPDHFHTFARPALAFAADTIAFVSFMILQRFLM